MSVNKLEKSRMNEALRGAGWTAEESANFILWVETGDKRYEPKPADRQ